MAAACMIFLLKRRADIWVCRAQRGSRYESALESYSAALAACANAPPAFAAVLHANRAAAHQAQGNIAEAIADSLRAKALEPSYAKVGPRYWMPYSSWVGSLSDRMNTTAVVAASTASHLPSME